MVKCPRCKVALINVGSIDIEYYNESYFDDVAGECPECGAIYRWTEQYKFHEIFNFEVEKKGNAD